MPKTISPYEPAMPKHYPVNKAPASLEPAEPDNVLPGASLEPPTAPAFWILKDAQPRNWASGQKEPSAIDFWLTLIAGASFSLSRAMRATDTSVKSGCRSRRSVNA